jgi:hypothetical protein
MAKDRIEKLTTNLEKIKTSQIITANQNKKRKQNKSQTNFIRNNLSQTRRPPNKE